MHQRWMTAVVALAVCALLVAEAKPWDDVDDEEDDAKAEAKAARAELRRKVYERVHPKVAQRYYCAKYIKENPQGALTEANCRVAVFGGGSFIKLRVPLKAVPGVVNTSLGYIGGWKQSVTYEDVCADRTGHSEAVLTFWNRDVVNFTKILEAFASTHDPSSKAKQGSLVGLQFRSVVFCSNAEQMEAFRAFKAEWNAKAVENKGLEEPKLFRTELTRLRPASFQYESRGDDDLLKSCHDVLSNVSARATALTGEQREKIEKRVTKELEKLKQQPRESAELEQEKMRIAKLRMARRRGPKLGADRDSMAAPLEGFRARPVERKKSGEEQPEAKPKDDEPDEGAKKKAVRRVARRDDDPAA